MPVPATGFRWFNEQQHLTLEEVRGQTTEHALGEEGRVLKKRFENPLVFELLHVFESRDAGRDVNSNTTSVANDEAVYCRRALRGFPFRRGKPEPATSATE